MNLLKEFLEGKKVTFHEINYGTLNLILNKKILVNIFGGFEYDDSWESLKGKKIKLFDDLDSEVIFKFEDGSKILIDKNIIEDPEVLSVYLPDGRIFVMN